MHVVAAVGGRALLRRPRRRCALRASARRAGASRRQRGRFAASPTPASTSSRACATARTRRRVVSCRRLPRSRGPASATRSSSARSRRSRAARLGDERGLPAPQRVDAGARHRPPAGAGVVPSRRLLQRHQQRARNRRRTAQPSRRRRRHHRQPPAQRVRSSLSGGVRRRPSSPTRATSACSTWFSRCSGCATTPRRLAATPATSRSSGSRAAARRCATLMAMPAARGLFHGDHDERPADHGEPRHDRDTHAQQLLDALEIPRDRVASWRRCRWTPS